MELSKRLASTALTYKDAYVFGGFVRDVVLRGEPAKDVDVTFANPDSMDHFVDVVRSMFPETTLSTRVSRYGALDVVSTLKVVSQSEKMSVDCVIRTMEQNPDFTCNSLRVSADGNLSLWCPGGTSSFRRLRELQTGLDDVRAKRFKAYSVPPSHKGKRYNRSCVKTIQRAMKMVDRGWEMYGGTRIGFVDRLVREATGVTMEQFQDKCSICHGEWSDPAIVCECGHAFHVECILQWLPKAEDETCPTCRHKRFMFA